MATKTWIYTGGTPSNYRTAGNWSPSGIPTAADDVIFDSVSGGSCIILTGTVHLCASITTTGYTGTFSGSAAWSVSGGMVLGSSTVWNYTGLMTFDGAGSFNITTNGKSFLANVTLNNAAGNWSILDNFLSTASLIFTQGTLSVLNSSNITCTIFNSNNANVRTLNMGNGVWTLTSTGTLWSLATSTNMTLNAQGSTILINNTTSANLTFGGGSLTYNIVQFSRGNSTGNNSTLGNNTFFNFIDNGTAAHNCFFAASSTNTFSNFNVNGNAGNNISVQESLNAAFNLVKIGTGVISVNFLNIRNSQATPATNTWYAGANSVNVGVGNTGWIFTAPPSNTSKNLLLLGVG